MINFAIEKKKKQKWKLWKVFNFQNVSMYSSCTLFISCVNNALIYLPKICINLARIEIFSNTFSTLYWEDFLSNISTGISFHLDITSSSECHLTFYLLRFLYFGKPRKKIFKNATHFLQNYIGVLPICWLLTVSSVSKS